MNAAADCATRTATPADAQALSDLLTELGFPASPPEVARRLENLMGMGEIVIVRTRGDEILGFVTLHRTPVLHRAARVGRLTALVVASRERGRGHGRALVAAAERHLASAGCELIEVTSNFKHAGAHTFYERLGYVKTSFRFGKTVPVSADS